MPVLARRRPLALMLALTLLVVLSAAVGQSDPVTAPDATWRTVVDPDHRFALLLPPGHDLARHGTQWYAHGWLDDVRLVPDMTVALLAGLTVDEVVVRDFPADAATEPVRLGPATRGVRVTAHYEGADGTPYASSSYLVQGPDGTFRIDRYENFAWPPFDAVARSFRFVEFVDDASQDR